MCVGNRRGVCCEHSWRLNTAAAACFSPLLTFLMAIDARHSRRSDITTRINCNSHYAARYLAVKRLGLGAANVGMVSVWLEACGAWWP